MSASYVGSLLFDDAAAGHLTDAEDDEFCGLHRREADLDDQLAGVDHLGRVGLLVTLDVEGLLRAGAMSAPLRQSSVRNEAIVR